MLIIKRCHQLTGVTNLLSYNTYPSFILLNYTARNFPKLCTEVRTLSIIRKKYKYKVDSSVQKIAHSLSRTNNALIHVKLAQQQKRCLSIAAKLVNNASPKVQPYMKLMRIDKPIGKV